MILEQNDRFPTEPHSLTLRVRVAHICVSKLTIIDSDNGLAPVNATILLIGCLRTNFREFLIEIYTLSLKKNAFENVVWKIAATLFLP